MTQAASVQFDQDACKRIYRRMLFLLESGATESAEGLRSYVNHLDYTRRCDEFLDFSNARNQMEARFQAEFAEPVFSDPGHPIWRAEEHRADRDKIRQFMYEHRPAQQRLLDYGAGFWHSVGYDLFGLGHAEKTIFRNYWKP
jgi:hypothetical protein